MIMQHCQSTHVQDIVCLWNSNYLKTDLRAVVVMRVMEFGGVFTIGL